MIKKNILILTPWSFNDALVQAYTLPYVHIIARKIPAGSKIYLVTFEQKQIALSIPEKQSVQSELLKKGIHLITFTYTPFGLKAMIKGAGALIKLLFIIIFKKINFIHAWCTPAGTLGYILRILTGRPLIIDSYEPHAEAMVENETWTRDQFRFRLLFFLERKMSERAKYIISATEGMREYAFRKYHVRLNNFYVKPACVDLNKFNPAKRKNKALLAELELTDKIVCVYAGKFGGIYLTDEVFRFFHFAEKKFGDKFRVLLLTSHNTADIEDWTYKNGFSKDKLIIRFVQHKDIADYIGLADFAITPVKPIPTKRYCTPIKNGEYWALGLPVVITKNISDDSDIIKENKAGVVIEVLNDSAYIKAVDEIAAMIGSNNNNHIYAVAEKYRSFDIAERIYAAIYS